MKDDNLYISDFCSNSVNDKTLGIYFYNTKVLYSLEVEDKVKSYKFILCAAKSKEDFISNKIEIFEFIATLNLKDYAYVKSNLIELKDLNFDSIEINFLKIIKKHEPELLTFLKSRLSFYDKNNLKKEPIYINNVEFLEFDSTAELLFDAYKYENKLGSYVYLKPINHNESFLDRLFEYSHVDKIKEYLLPIHLRNFNFDNLQSNKKLIFLLNLDKLDQVDIYKKYYKNLVDDKNMEWYLSDYKVTITGNDDTSYTKYFLDKKDAENELLFLRNRQPLNMYKDIFERNYFFTN